MEDRDQVEKEQTAIAPPIPSIINKPVPLEILEIMDWQSHLTDYDWTDHRWNATQLTNQRSEELAKEGHQQEALVLKLLSSVISMHFVGNVTEPLNRPGF
ncbi:hypothetical protein [Xanthomonas citri]|uniref:hypothetical protein n=1 Tax=Xanthomonas citri TaxID=346 RepID=UPI00052BCEFC|nr:hypothetical protein [Xanthomonas citri]CEH58575.1 hypothetical protein XAC3610_3890001 [Xanthomonas citri pv. citri]